MGARVYAGQGMVSQALMGRMINPGEHTVIAGVWDEDIPVASSRNVSVGFGCNFAY